MTITIDAAQTGSRVTLTTDAFASGYGVPEGSSGTVNTSEGGYRESYVNFDNLRGLWVSWDDLEEERPLTVETADTLERFQRLVIQKSYERQAQHSLCTEVQNFLRDDLGLTLPRRKVAVTIEVEVEDTGEYNSTSTAQRLALTAVRAVEGQDRARVVTSD